MIQAGSDKRYVLMLKEQHQLAVDETFFFFLMIINLAICTTQF
jgi:hypothetical protein